MSRVTDAQLASNARIADVRHKVTEAIGAAGLQHKDLTYDEVVEALMIVAQRVLQHQRAAGLEDPDGD